MRQLHRQNCLKLCMWQFYARMWDEGFCQEAAIANWMKLADGNHLHSMHETNVVTKARSEFQCWYKNVRVRHTKLTIDSFAQQRLLYWWQPKCGHISLFCVTNALYFSAWMWLNLSNNILVFEFTGASPPTAGALLRLSRSFSFAQLQPLPCQLTSAT